MNRLKGIARSVAMTLVGDRTESIYRRYAVASESDRRAAVEKLEAVTANRSCTESGFKRIRH
jgi:hypothetical protein